LPLKRNPRVGIKRNKYKALIVDSRRDRVKELLVKGYSQEEISNTLRISQPTVSRDLQYINDGSRKKIDMRDVEDIVSHYSMIFLHLDQLTRSLWKIVNHPRTKDYAKLKAIKLLEECSLQRLLLADRAVHDAVIPYITKRIKEVNERDRTLKSRERDLENYAKKHNLRMHDFSFKEK
jgi:predicted transcriptional regulator